MDGQSGPLCHLRLIERPLLLLAYAIVVSRHLNESKVVCAASYGWAGDVLPGRSCLLERTAARCGLSLRSCEE